MEINKFKQKIRKEIYRKKLQLDNEDRKYRSSLIFKKIEELREFRSASVIMAYWSLKDEVFTHDFIEKWYREKQILLPVVKKENLSVRLFTGAVRLEKEKNLGVMEPLGSDYNIETGIDLIIVPGVAFDSDGNRIGRGKAYYDKFLSTVGTFRIGVCFNFQLLDRIPVTPLDMRMDKIITE